MLAQSQSGFADEIFCIGGKQTIEAFAPFASRVLMTQTDDIDDIWLPSFIRAEQNMHDGQKPLWSSDVERGASFYRWDFRRFQPIEF